MNYNKYEDYIRVGHTATQDANGNWICTDLQDFPTPSTFGRTLHDVDVDAYTDLEGYTQRNRVRHDVEDVSIAYSILSDEDEQYILNRISPDWIFVELTDKKTGQKKVHKMYASDKEWDTFAIVKDQNDVWHTQDVEFGFSLVEQ
jgi:hypothetical protein